MAREPCTIFSPMPATRSGWKMRAKTEARTVEMARTMSAGRLRAMSQAVTSGTTMSQGLRLKVRSSACAYCSTCAAGTPWCERPRTVKTMSVMVMDGTVVTIR